MVEGWSQCHPSFLKNKTMEQNRIEELLAKVNTLTDEERKEIKIAAGEAGLNVKFKTGCRNCWHDALVMLGVHNRRAAMPKRATVSDEPWKNVTVEPLPHTAPLRLYRNGSWLVVDHTTKAGMKALRELWEAGRQNVVLQHYKVTKTENVEERKEAEDGEA